MPKPTGSKAKRCRLQRALFRKNPVYAKEWVQEQGDQCKGVSMAATKKKGKKGNHGR